MHLEHCPFDVACTIEILNDTQKPSSFTPNEVFVGTKGERYFRNYHSFGSHVHDLDSALQAGKKIPNWRTHSKACTFVRKSTHHAVNFSLALDPEPNCATPSFHTVHDDDFQTVVSKTSITLPPNWRDTFAINHCADDENFTSPLIAKVKGSEKKSN